MVMSRQRTSISFIISFWGRHSFLAILSLWAALIPSNSGMAQNPDPGTPLEIERARSFRDRVTDRASLKDGTQLYGMAVSEKPAKIVVRTAWVEQQLP